jgi:hypothetical protein
VDSRAEGVFCFNIFSLLTIINDIFFTSASSVASVVFLFRGLYGGKNGQTASIETVETDHLETVEKVPLEKAVKSW